MNEFKGMNWHEWVETNVKRMKWNEWVEMHDLSTSSWKSGTHPSVFDEFYVINYLMTMSSTDEMELSLQSRAHFVDLIVDLIFKKCKKAVSFFFNDFYVKSSYSLVRMLSTAFPDQGAHPRKQRPCSGDHGRPL